MITCTIHWKLYTISIFVFAVTWGFPKLENEWIIYKEKIMKEREALGSWLNHVIVLKNCNIVFFFFFVGCVLKAHTGQFALTMFFFFSFTFTEPRRLHRHHMPTMYMKWFQQKSICVHRVHSFFFLFIIDSHSCVFGEFSAFPSKWPFYEKKTFISLFVLSFLNFRWEKRMWCR